MGQVIVSRSRRLAYHNTTSHQSPVTTTQLQHIPGGGLAGLAAHSWAIFGLIRSEHVDHAKTWVMILDDGHTLPHGHYEGINSGGGAAPEISAGADLRNSHTQPGSRSGVNKIIGPLELLEFKVEFCFTRHHFVIPYSLLATGNILLMFNSLPGQNIRLHIIYFGGGCDRTSSTSTTPKLHRGEITLDLMMSQFYWFGSL